MPVCGVLSTYIDVRLGLRPMVVAQLLFAIDIGFKSVVLPLASSLMMVQFASFPSPPVLVQRRTWCHMICTFAQLHLP